MAYLGNLYTALRSAIAAVWTDTPAHGIWESEHVNMVAWDSLVPPYAVIVISEGEENEEFSGLNALVYEFPVELYYVGATTGDGGTLRTKLEAMRDRLWATDPTPGQILRIPTISWSRDLPPNQSFESKNFTHRAGLVRTSVIAGEI